MLRKPATYALPPFVSTLVAVGVVAALVRLGRGAVPIDDAFITFRYVENIVQGFGFVYNLDERILGTSTPLYALLLAVLYRILPTDLVTISLYLNSLADGITTVALGILGWKLSGSRLIGLACAAIWCLSIAAVFFSRTGMETALFTMTTTLAFLSLIQRNLLVACAFASIAVLLRPDGVIVLALVGLGTVLVERRTLLSAIAVVVAIIAPWLVFSIWYFGSPIPQSALVKVAANSNMWQVLEQVGVALPTTYTLGGATRQLFGPFAVGVVVLCVGAMTLGYASALRTALSPPTLWICVLSYPLLYLLVIISRNIFLFPWYFMPIQPVIILGVLTGGYAFRPTAGYMLAGMLLAFNISAAFVNGNITQLEQREHERLTLYIGASQAIAARVGDNDTATRIATPEVGIIGYYLHPRPMIDLAGLVSAPQRGTTPDYDMLVGMQPHLPEQSDYLRVWEQHGAGGQTAAILCTAELPTCQAWHTDNLSTDTSERLISP